MLWLTAQYIKWIHSTGMSLPVNPPYILHSNSFVPLTSWHLLFRQPIKYPTYLSCRTVGDKIHMKPKSPLLLISE
jgi:hypothetical protein